MQHFNRDKFVDELKQKQAITNNLMKKILYSKRLLIDHVESLEQCLKYLKIDNNVDAIDGPKNNNVKSKATNSSAQQIFTAQNTCFLLGGTILEHFITPKWLRLTLIPSVLLTSGFTAVYVVKNIFMFRNKIVERELDNLIRTIDEFGNCIRRNMTYFNEILIMKQQELIESRQIERAWDCITSAKEVTEILYDATRKLETQYPLPAKFSQYYSPMEELRECDYFKNNVTDYSPKHIKDFHNIFAYVQSQFLLRLALTISTKPSISRLDVELVKIDCQIRQLIIEEESHFKNLTIDIIRKKQIGNNDLNATKTMQNRTGPVAVLQHTSLKLSACMVAVAGECQALDITLQRLNETENNGKDNSKQLLQVATNMRGIENTLSICFEDFQRLMLVYNKFLSSKLDDKDLKKEINENHIDQNQNDEFPESILRVEISQNPIDADKHDDFYAYMLDEHQLANEADAINEQSADLEILNFEKRITKGKFRPVLKQLKDRIDPIRREMFEKERRILAAKGINVDEFFQVEDEKTHQLDERSNDKVLQNDNQLNDTSNTDDDSDGSADLEYQNRIKKLKEHDNYAEMRNFLAQKQSINLFKLAPPPKEMPQMNNEEILESEC